MEKMIQDYLHLYLGCEVLWETLDGTTGGREILDGHLVESQKHTTGTVVRPILRPLSSMTEEEQIFILHMHMKPGWVGVTLLESNDDDWAMRVKMQTDGEAWKSLYVSKKKMTPQLFKHMLSLGFDLFDLIPSGLAIDKTKTT